MSVVVVDEGDVETEDEKNQREIEEFILSSVSIVYVYSCLIIVTDFILLFCIVGFG
mgnify:CR=1 FL=1